MKLLQRFRHISKIVVTVLIIQMGFIATAHAGLIITSNTEFDDAFSFGLTTGSFSDTSAGVTQTSTFSDFTATINPLMGTWSMAGDGVVFDAMTDGDITDDAFAIGIDSSVQLFNSHATDIFQVVFQFMFNNQVEATGGDAFSDSEFTIFEDGSEIFFTDLISDSLNGNNDGSGFGGVLSDSGSMEFMFTLNPGDTINLALSLTIEGEDLAGGFVNADFDQSFKIKSLTNLSDSTPNDVPEPSTMLILISALALLIRRKL